MALNSFAAEYYVYKDLDGNPAEGTIVLNPFESKILILADEIPEPCYLFFIIYSLFLIIKKY